MVPLKRERRTCNYYMSRKSIVVFCRFLPLYHQNAP